MKTIISLICLCSVSLCASAIERDGAPAVTRWKTDDGKTKPFHSVPHYAETLKLKKQSTGIMPLGGQLSGRICLVTHTDVYETCETEIQQYAVDLQAAGYSVVSYTYESGTPDALRATLSNFYYQSESLAGAIFIGDIPHVIYELIQQFWNDPAPYYEDFPCDLFYMDVNGGWHDYSNSPPYSVGKYDTRSGDKALEIWIARMKTDTLTGAGTETGLLHSYFQKNHAYRAGSIASTNRAVVYNDDDWAYMGLDDSNEVHDVYLNGTVVCYTNWNDTTVDDYTNNQLTAVYDFIFMRSHGSASSHLFYKNGIPSTVFYTDYLGQDPQAVFYSLFICAGADYTAQNYLTGVTVFNPSSTGLVSFGSTKMGGMWNANVFYDSLAAGKSVGESFRVWFNDIQHHYSIYVDDRTPRWWYGMSLCGDAALPMRIPDTLYVSLEGGNVFPYTSWETAATNIGIAVDSAGAGSVIIVSNGVFDISEKILIDRNNIILMSLNGRDNTIVDAGFPLRTNTCVEVRGDNVRVDGFTFTGGAGLAYPDNTGAGFRMHWESDGCVLQNCIVHGNTALYGGGVKGRGFIDNCVISNNYADYGGGMHLDDDSVVQNCVIADNYATRWGGAAFILEGTIRDTVIRNNSSDEAGGGVYISAGGMLDTCDIIENTSVEKAGGVYFRVKDRIRNCLIAGNFATNGGGAYSSGDSYGAGTIESCTIAGNRATTGGGIFCANGGTNWNNIIYHNTASSGSEYYNTGASNVYYYCCTRPFPAGDANGGGVITNDPLFVDQVGGNYRLRIGSLCINAGTNMAWMLSEEDNDGNPRIHMGIVDIGCYEAIPEPVCFVWVCCMLFGVCFRRTQDT